VQDEPDRDLLRRFTQGDRQAFEALFRQFEREVYRWIVRIVREPTAAEDALIEAFWRAYRGRARFDPSRSFGAWMRRIATHTAIDQLNAARRRRWVPLDVGRVPPGDRVSLDVGRVPPSDGAMLGGPGVIVGQVPPTHAATIGPGDPDLADHIRRAFASLPTELRIVATLALIEECPQADIADALGIPIGTVKSRLFRATRQLRKELERLGIHA
jgi:RNA polymerase sigma-70 factor, ECF subfamily